MTNREAPGKRAGAARVVRIARKVVTLVVLTSLMVSTSPSPAAAIVTDVDEVLINTPTVDFGLGGHAWGAPTRPATITWVDNQLDQRVVVKGSFHLDDFWGSSCLSGVIDLRDRNRRVIRSEYAYLCSPRFSGRTSKYFRLRHTSSNEDPIESVRICVRAIGSRVDGRLHCRIEENN